MPDITVTWNAILGRGDWSFSNGDLTTGNDLQSAVLISLFTDGRAPDDYVPTDGTNDRRGWWADTYEDRPIGSLLWTLERSKKVGATSLLTTARNTCLSALQWLLDDGVASSLNVQTAWLRSDVLGITVEIFEPANLTPFRYAFAWSTAATAPAYPNPISHN